MRPEQALQILDTAASQAPITRLEHVRVQEATRILTEFILSIRRDKTKAPDGGKADGTDTE